MTLEELAIDLLRIALRAIVAAAGATRAHEIVTAEVDAIRAAVDAEEDARFPRNG